MQKKTVKKIMGITGSLFLFCTLLFLFFSIPSFGGQDTGKCLGVDVSSHNDVIDWAAAKAGGVEFAIIRIGWGDDLYYQDDPMAEYNMQQCEQLGIPYGVYIYSYALSEREVQSEVAHTLRMIQGHNPQLGIWFDMEDADAYKQRHNFNPYTHGEQLTNFCIKYVRGIKAAGYTNVGVYANPDYFWYVLDYNVIKAEGMIWLAHWYVDAPAFECVMWQYAANGRIAGSNLNFDMNWIFRDSPLFEIIAGPAPVPVPMPPVEPSSETPVHPEQPIIYGDLDSNGVIDVMDLANIQKHLLGKSVLQGNAFLSGDINHDGQITVLDLAAVQKHLLGKRDLWAEQQ